MNRSRKRLFLGLAITVLVSACGSAGSATSRPLGPSSLLPSTSSPTTETQRSEGGQVTVEATWPGPVAGVVFDLKLDTHSVDLDPIDLSNTVLRNDRGDSLTAAPWTAPKGGHHREGTLAFRGDAAGFLAGAKWIELVLTGVGDLPERDLRWQIGP